MSDLDDLVLDRAFASLTRDLSHSPGPGAAAAITTARKRRRTRVGAVALATALVVGGGLTVPRLVFPEGGVAAGGGSARLDAAALDRATEGWLSDWETWELYSPYGGGGFSTAGCSTVASPDGDRGPEPQSLGTSRFVTPSGATLLVTMEGFADAERARSSQDLSHPDPDTCGTTTTYVVDGVEVRHDSMPPEVESDDDAWLGDVWSARIGSERVEAQLINDTGVADDRAAERMAEAVVAGLRDGWTQSGMEAVRRQPQTPQLPPFDDGELGRALGGWSAASRGHASTVPNTPCLGESVGTGAVTASSGGTPDGVTWDFAGYDDGAAGAARIAAMLDELRACVDSAMSVDELPNGVTLVTYDYGAPEGRGALWLAENGDRAGAIGVDGADRPMPRGVGEAVAEVLHTHLRLAWDAAGD
jgi:hypothetical protein